MGSTFEIANSAPYNDHTRLLNIGTKTHAQVDTFVTTFYEAPHFTFDGGGAAIATGYKGSVIIPYNGTITGWTLLSVDSANTAGAIVIYIEKCTYANFPSSWTAIYASDPPTITATNTKGQNLNASTWTTTVSAGDIWRLRVYSCTSILTALLVVNITRS
jgi:hypothetical protein